MNEVYRLELRNVSKSFGEVNSLKDINFRLGQNEVVGVVGDNGAGKSTLIKIITGYHQPDEGELYFDGVKVEGLTVPKARELGVETVYQERALAELQTLWRNIFMGREIRNQFGLLDVKRMKEETFRLMNESMGFTSTAITPDSPIRRFSGGEKQGVAIVRALYFDADIIILDEPTMGLSLHETRQVIGLRAQHQTGWQIRHFHRPQHPACAFGCRSRRRDRPRPAWRANSSPPTSAWMS